ncbi:putative sphingosine kinase [Helianthus annuus]|uniref:Sphingosine kinase n=1 Tax=Helianthus annuus TaxID=4232 RepID=A0A9K3HK48_HELAN|nr:putative sphingosine kinase [Helianthus annuus]KAJ0864590.1 putative sphingosine kinase [Helianthus annuus]
MGCHGKQWRQPHQPELTPATVGRRFPVSGRLRVSTRLWYWKWNDKISSRFSWSTLYSCLCYACCHSRWHKRSLDVATIWQGQSKFFSVLMLAWGTIKD